MKITPIDIQQQDFKTRFRGYDCEEVDAFLRSVSESLEDVVKENAALKERLDTTEEQLRTLRQRESALNDLLVTTQNMTENLKQSAHREADLILKEAELKAEEILKKTQEEYSVLQHEIMGLQREKILTLQKCRGILQMFQKMIELEELDQEGVEQRTRYEDV
jgi:cell division initiation protein